MLGKDAQHFNCQNQRACNAHVKDMSTIMVYGYTSKAGKLLFCLHCSASRQTDWDSLQYSQKFAELCRKFPSD